MLAHSNNICVDPKHHQLQPLVKKINIPVYIRVGYYIASFMYIDICCHMLLSHVLISLSVINEHNRQTIKCLNFPLKLYHEFF